MDIRKMLEKAGMTQMQLARYMGVTDRTVRNWVSGSTTPNKYEIEILKKLSGGKK